jgi:hypothetical protein
VAHRRGGLTGGAVFTGRMARPEGNDGEGRCPVVVVNGSRFRMVVETRAVVGVASIERKGS